ncbi:MAG: ABC transporter ATP-binding protein/permease [Clostridiales bacterium]|jgi:ATP-binding cassette subfamily B protein|nr:ABC transporter ATP-binding protein/permease [Clostridiales bacterium]
MKKVLACIKGYRLDTVFTIVFVLLEVLLEVALPMLMAKIVDVGLKDGAVSWSTSFLGINLHADTAMHFILLLGALMIVLSGLSLLFGVLSGKYAAVSSCGFAKNLRLSVFSRVQDFSFGNVDRFSTPSLITRLTTDIQNVQQTYMMSTRLLARAPFMLILASVMTLTINLEVSLIILLSIPVLAAVFIIFARYAIPRFTAMFKKYDKMNADVQENLIAIRVVKAFVRGGRETDKFKASSEDVRQAMYNAEKLLIIAMPLIMMFMYGAILAVCGFGGMKIIGGAMESGEFISMITYITQILFSLMMISMVLVMAVMSKASVTRISEVLKETPEIDENADGAAEVADGAVDFENVSFSYAKKADNLTLSDVNISIKPGEMIGIVGGTGSAKTTLVQLIPRLYDVYGGSVKVGGRDVRDYSVKALRDKVAMVLQKNVLFSGTIKDNLRWGDAEATDAEIEEAARRAQAHDFISSFPDGYETTLGQGGVNLSGGQKQRLCIARALLKKPKILILDDSTSAVDTATDSKIRAELKKNLRGTTVIIIAQRVSSIADADRIFVLDDGKVTAQGTHSELLQTCGIYREVYQSQQGDLD